MHTWSRKNGYEVSSKGDKRFSAFYAKMPDGRTLEEWYQCDVKGYDIGGYNWKLGKGKPSLLHYNSLLDEYVNLWHIYFNQDCKFFLLQELHTCILPNYNFVLSDRFATTEINQANAISIILNQYYHHNPECLIKDYFNLLIAGSRHFNDFTIIERECSIIMNELYKSIDKVNIIQGGAKGADMMGCEFGNKYNLPVYTLKPHYDLYPKNKAPFIRNAEMGDISDGLLAFWDYHSNGTKHMIEYMYNRNKYVKIIDIREY